MAGVHVAECPLRGVAERHGFGAEWKCRGLGFRVNVKAAEWKCRGLGFPSRLHGNIESVY